MIELCPHGDIPAACLDCLHEKPLDPDSRSETVKAVAFLRAKFPGHCEGCNVEIHEGQDIARMSNETYRHARC